ncbi:hypothetical protein [Herbaspirillum frisingense]
MTTATLFDQVIAHLGLKNDAHLARHLQTAPRPSARCATTSSH